MPNFSHISAGAPQPNFSQSSHSHFRGSSSPCSLATSAGSRPRRLIVPATIPEGRGIFFWGSGCGGRIASLRYTGLLGVRWQGPGDPSKCTPDPLVFLVGGCLGGWTPEFSGTMVDVLVSSSGGYWGFCIYWACSLLVAIPVFLANTSDYTPSQTANISSP